MAKSVAKPVAPKSARKKSPAKITKSETRKSRSKSVKKVTSPKKVTEKSVPKSRASRSKSVGAPKKEKAEPKIKVKPVAKVAEKEERNSRARKTSKGKGAAATQEAN